MNINRLEYVCFVSEEYIRGASESKYNTQGAGYKTIADLLEGFNAAGCLPRAINLSKIDDGKGIEATLRKYKATWHDSSRL